MLSMTRLAGRQLVGRVVRDELARQGLSQQKAAERAGVTRDTISRVINATPPTVSAVMLRRLEGALSLPRYLLDYIEAGEADRIRRVDMEPDLKRSILELLDPESLPPMRLTQRDGPTQ